MSFTACASAVKAAITQRIEAIPRPRLRKPSDYFNTWLAPTSRAIARPSQAKGIQFRVSM